MRAARVGIAVVLMASVAACGGSDNAGDTDKADPPTGQSQSADQSQSAGQNQSADQSPAAGQGGSTEGSAPADPSQAADPVAGTSPLPATGECWSLTAEELDEGMAMISSASAALDCAAKHNAITVAVVGITDEQAAQLGETVNAGTAVDPAHADVWRAVVGPACSGAFNEAFASAVIPIEHDGIESVHKASTLRGYGWLPTATDWQSGARWIRCDVANRIGAPISYQQPSFDLQTIPDDLVACMNANVEGVFPVPCADPLANAQALATVALDAGATADAKSDYETFKTEAANVCADAVAVAFPNAGKPGLAALPIEFAFTGRFDCYIEHAAGEPLLN